MAGSVKKKEAAKSVKAAKEEKPAVKAEPKKEGKPVKKAVRKTAPKKTAAKTAAKKGVAKKPAKKAVKKVEKKNMTAAQYADKIRQKKKEAQDKNWLYIEVNAGDLNKEFEEIENLEAVCTALTDELLEGDCFIVDPFGTSPDLTVRYYVDNLSPDRKKYYDVNK